MSDCCVKCGAVVAPLIIAGQRLCGNHWSMTPHFAELMIERVNEVSDEPTKDESEN